MSIPEKCSNEFYETRDIYAEYIGYTGKLDYEDWIKLPDDHKAAALYVRFFYPILDAWHKTKYLATPEDTIDILCQYLLKNVEIIKEHPERYTEGYIHTVAYNCMFNENHCKKKDKERAEREIYEHDVKHLSEYSAYEDGYQNDYKEDFEFCTDLVTSENILEEVMVNTAKYKLWSQIEELGADAVKVAEDLGNGLKLRGIRGLNKEQKAKIVEKLIPILTEYKAEVG